MRSSRAYLGKIHLEPGDTRPSRRLTEWWGCQMEQSCDGLAKRFDQRRVKTWMAKLNRTKCRKAKTLKVAKEDDLYED